MVDNRQRGRAPHAVPMMDVMRIGSLGCCRGFYWQAELNGGWCRASRRQTGRQGGAAEASGQRKLLAGNGHKPRRPEPMKGWGCADVWGAAAGGRGRQATGVFQLLKSGSEILI